MPRGFVAIGLQNPKNSCNVGSVFRAAGCYESDLIIIAGARRFKSLTSVSSDTQKTWRHIPVIQPLDVFDAAPLGVIPIAIDLLPGAENLVNFTHPERALYLRLSV